MISQAWASETFFCLRAHIHNHTHYMFGADKDSIEMDDKSYNMQVFVLVSSIRTFCELDSFFH